MGTPTLLRKWNPNFTFKNFFSENRTVYEIMSKKSSGDRGVTNDVTIWRTRVACGISKATCTYAHAHAPAPGYRHARACTHRPVNNTYCFSTATVICEHASVTLYVHCLSCCVMLDGVSSVRQSTNQSFVFCSL